MNRLSFVPLTAFAGLALAACASSPPLVVAPLPATTLSALPLTRVDTSRKEPPRLIPPEATLRTYLRLFGGLAPLELETTLRGKDGSALFDTWDDYVAALGLPDYRLDVPRQSETNALMVATFERIGVALCDRALEHDWKPPKGAEGPKERLIFAFDPPRRGVAVSDREFHQGFDILHRTFLGYPAALAPAEREARYRNLFVSIEKTHASPTEKSRFTPDEAAWAAVCYGLVRHPEFHLY